MAVGVNCSRLRNIVCPKILPLEWHALKLNTCGQYLPRSACRPPTENWRWVSSGSNLSDAVTILHWGVVGYVSRVFDRGIYLPGWWKPDNFGFRAIRPYRRSVGCGGNDKPGEFLILPTGGYQWSSFSAGDKLPSDAIVGGYWMDPSPLYIVKKTIGGVICLDTSALLWGKHIFHAMVNIVPPQWTYFSTSNALFSMCWPYLWKSSPAESLNLPYHI